MKIHCFIISWDKQYSKASKIASNILEDVDSLTVIYSNKNNDFEDGAGKWIKVSNEWFYGRKFKKALELINENEVMLVIQADANYGDWEELVKRCKNIMRENSFIGIWAPNIDHTPWTNNVVSIAKNEDAKLHFVTQTDGIVFAYNPKVVDRLKYLNYDCNNLGWGIDWIAICYTYIHNMYVIRDMHHTVNHTVGSGYLHSEATTQMNMFINQMTSAEMIMYKLLNSYSDQNVTALRTHQILE